MTEKAEQILNQMREKDRRRRLALMNNPNHRNRMLESLNRDSLDEGAAPIGNGQMTILKDMESLDQEHDQYMQDLKGGSHAD